MCSSDLVIDEELPVEVQKERCQELIGILKRHDPIFQNTRLNMIHWGSTISEENVSAPKIILGSCFMGTQEYEKLTTGACPHAGYDELLTFLRLFQARSKIIILLAKEKNTRETEESRKLLQPFLGRKMIRFYL